MSILSKFKSFLFAEEEMEDEIIVEDKLEPVVLSKPITESKPKEKEVVASMETPVEVKKAEGKEGTHFGSITLDEPQKKTATPLTRKPLERNDLQEFTFSDVISPMYGTGKVEAGKKVDYSATHTKKNNPLGTIISPMYGAKELKEMEEHAQTLLNEQEETKTIIKEDDDLVDIPLEQMLVKDEPVSNDDVLQFSLFGDDEIVKHAMHDDLMDDLGKKA